MNNEHDDELVLTDLELAEIAGGASKVSESNPKDFKLRTGMPGGPPDGPPPDEPTQPGLEVTPEGETDGPLGLDQT